MNALVPKVSVVVDMSSIQKAVDLALRNTSRRMEVVLGTTAYRVAWKAGKYTPFVEISTIDQELDSAATLKSGKKTDLTAGQAIVLARMNPNSRYNQLTDNRWAIKRPVFSAAKFERAYGDAGMAKQAWLNFIESAEERQKAGRHSSTHFLQSGWKAVKLKIRALGFRLGGGISLGTADDNSPLNTLNPSKLGDVMRGGQGTATQWIIIENQVGLDSQYPNLSHERNSALIDLGLPALQRGLDEQAQEMRDWNLNKDIEAELAAEWNSILDAAPYQKGVHVSAIRLAESEIAVGEEELHAFT